MDSILIPIVILVVVLAVAAVTKVGAKKFSSSSTAETTGDGRDSAPPQDLA